MNHKGLCPCNSGNQYSNCCGPLIAGDEIALTAEALMRSRYTAYVLQDASYLLKTWHFSKKPSTIGSLSGSEWYGLNIINTEEGGKDHNRGIVEFKASVVRPNKIWRHHEISRFVKEDGKWFYIDGELLESPPPLSTKVGRNAPCPCGSGKKYKKCCGK